MASNRVLLLAAAAILAALLPLVPAQNYPGGVISSTATFYGGATAAGTMGGACGYGNLYNTGFGVATAAASVAMWDNAAICGACFNVWCVNNKYCIPGASVTVTVTNLCPQGSFGGWCNFPRQHLDMAYPSWRKIAKDPMAGVVTTQMKRVPCPKRDSVCVTLTGNPWYTMMLIYGVSGPGSLGKVEVSTDSGKTWQGCQRNWGSIWSGGVLLNNQVSMRLTANIFPQTVTIMNFIPKNWRLGGTYCGKGNF